MGEKTVEHDIHESADKYEANAKIKRGTGTRDQDTINLKAKGDDPVDVVNDLHEMIAEAEKAADGARNIQPEHDDGGDDGDGE